MTLLQRLEKAEGASRELDRELEKLYWPEGVPQWQTDAALPKFTSSLDASIALVERVLPGWDWHVAKLGENKFSAAIVTWKGSDGGGADDSKTPALALLTALLKALQHKETQG